MGLLERQASKILYLRSGQIVSLVPSLTAWLVLMIPFQKAERRCVITAFTEPPGQTESAVPDDLLSAANAVYWVCVKRGFSGVTQGLGKW